MAHLTPRSLAEWEYLTADRVGNDSVSSAKSSGQPTTSKSSKDSHRKDKDNKSSDKKGKAPAVPPAMPQAMTPAIPIPGRSSSQGQVDARAYTATPIGSSVSTSVSSVPTSEHSSPMMSGGIPPIDSQDGSRKGRLLAEHNQNFCVEPQTPEKFSPPTGVPAFPSQPVAGILRLAPDSNAPPAQAINRHIKFAQLPAEDAPPPRDGPSAYTKKAHQDERKRRKKELEEERVRNMVSGKSYSGSSSSAQYGNYGWYGEDEDYQAGRYSDDYQGSGSGYPDY